MTAHTYDDFPYLCLIRPDIQPGHLATLATLFNLQPPLVATARILELGCGNGINLLATAQSLPQAYCLGIDYSARQIAEGQKIIQAVGLKNIVLKQLDILDINDSWEQFDYIIIHGVYSWVTPRVQHKLLSICQHHLLPNGIAYISYNTYPGWYLNQITRDMIQYYHVHQFTDKRIRPLETQQLLQEIIAHNQYHQDAYTLLLQEQLVRLQKPDGDNYLYHDWLEAENHPLYFYQFIEQAQQCKLEYVTDVKFRDVLSAGQTLKPNFRGDWVTHEQYMDFFTNRKLRMTLLCHQGLTVNRELDPQLMSHFYIAAMPFLQATNSAIENNSAAVIFYQPHSQPVPINNPLTIVALLYLIDIYPSNIFFPDLVTYLYSQQSGAISTHDELSQNLAKELLTGFCQELISLDRHAITRLPTSNSDYPTVIPLARWQAAQGQTTVVNSRGQLGQLDEFTCQLLPYLNGKNNRATLLKVIKRLVEQQPITVMVNEQEVLCSQLAEAELGQILNLYLEEILQIIARHALLVA
jgi:methyltransferase-like protein/2-polyprenyl-3-methyl-5-hydroxy-6-metoxy-1,4-benzoquinol methylase